MLPSIQGLQAIAAGNSVLIKPSVHGTPPIRHLLTLAKSAGLPDGVMQVLPEEPEAATLAIRKGVDKVFLTGSANTGRAVSHELAESTTPCVMELSGCDAVFVLEDADLNLVSDCLLLGLTFNQSQTCMAPRRVFVRHRQADELVRLLKAKLENRVRAVLDQQEALDGSSASAQPAELRFPPPATRRDRMQEQLIAAAVQQGAELVVGSLAGGSREDQIGVMVLDRVSSQMSIAQKDLFAPVLSVIRVESDSQALQENARCPFALSATVFGSRANCHELARRIPAGCVVINDMIVPTADPRVPFGGRLMSGHGKTRGQAGLLEMTHLKAIVATRRWFKPHLHQPTVADSEVLEQLIRLEHAAGPLQTLKALPKMIQATIQQVRLRSKPIDFLQERSTKGIRS
jgi:acyl-CoA reductase-like NAD-dependent aldehyde dehydrogenase